RQVIDEPAQFAARGCGQVAAVEGDAAGLRPDQPGDQAEECRLADAVRSDQDGQGATPQRTEAAVGENWRQARPVAMRQAGGLEAHRQPPFLTDRMRLM